MKTLDLFRNEENYVTFAHGDTIIAEGQTGDLMYAVIEGEVDLTLANGQLVETVGPGGLFGEMAVVDKSPRTATATAKTNCKIVPINQKRFLFLVQQTPYFAIHMLQLLADRLRRMDEVVKVG